MKLELNLKEEYKETELGLLPEDWEVVRLGDVITPDRSKIKREHYKGDISIVQKISFNTGQIDFRNKRSTRTDLYVADRDHLLISKINFHQGAVAITNTLTAATTHYEFYKISDKADIFYLWRYFRTEEFKNIFSQEIKFRGFKKEANFKFIKNFKIPLPPLSEQKKIAYVLSVVQEAKEKTEYVIKATKEFKKSMMKHLFTYGPVSFEEAEKVPLKETEIGLIPEEWEVKNFGEIVEIRKEIIDPSNGNYIYVGLEHIESGNIKLRKTGLSKEVKSAKYKIYPNDILYAKLRPYLDKGILVEQEGICSTDLLVFKAKENVYASFIAYLEHTNYFREYAIKTMTGVNHPRTSWRALSQLTIPYPPLSEQKKIASILLAIDQKIEAEENKKKALEDLFKSLLYNLMIAKIRVNHLENVFDG